MKKLLLGFVLGLVCPLIAVVIAAYLGLLPIGATSEPSALEIRLADTALMASVAKDAARLSNPVPDTEDTLLAGMKIYRDVCAGCHGDVKGPSHWGTHNFYPRVPQFAQDLPDLPAPEMFVIVKHGIRYTGMGAWDGEISDEDIWRVVTFLTRLGTLPPAVDAAWKTKPKS
jgi:mono/diheme cytochrome c family protein